jgi:hypothetical protein
VIEMVKAALKVWRSIPFRASIVAAKLMCFYVLSLKGGAFFYQQF